MEALTPSSASRLPAFGALLGTLLLGPAIHAETVASPRVAGAPTAVAMTMPEYQLKAVYLLQFTRYVTWPADRFTSPDAPIILGVLGPNPFGSTLDEVFRDKTSQGRRIEVRFLRSLNEAAQCHVVFLAARQEAEEQAWLQSLAGQSVLTVTESEQGLTRGAVLSLQLEDGPRGKRVAFSASLVAARTANLQLSASMLASARRVLRETPTPRP